MCHRSTSSAASPRKLSRSRPSLPNPPNRLAAASDKGICYYRRQRSSQKARHGSPKLHSGSGRRVHVRNPHSFSGASTLTALRNPLRKRVLSGMRSTGKLHLGNYVGALDNWVRMQDQYECFFFVADWHALTTDYADTSQVKQNSIEVLLDWLAAGLDPERCTMFIQSHVPQHSELHLLFSM